MLRSRVYRTALFLGLGSTVIYKYRDEVQKNVSSQRWDQLPFAKNINIAAAESFQNIPVDDLLSKWDNNWDKRECDSKSGKDGEEKKKSKAARHIILVRHGQYVHGKTDEDRILTALGKEQADLTGQRLKSLNISSIYESTMTRAKETSSIIQKHFPEVEVHASDLLREGAPIPPIPSHSAWKPTDAEFFAEGARIEAAFRKFIHRAEPEQEERSMELFVCHGNVIRYIVCRALQFPPEAWLRLSLANGSITWLRISPSGSVSLRLLGGAGHLPMDKITYN